MKLKQLSVFLENKPGKLREPCRALADAGINILTLSLADTGEYGILRISVREWERGKAALEAIGCVVKVVEVVAIEVNDQPGGAASVLDGIEKLGMNVEYMYAFTCRCHADGGVLLFRFTDPDAAIASLTSAGVNVIGSVALFESVGH